MTRILILVIFLLFFFSCQKKERILRTTSIQIKLDQVVFKFTPASQSSHLSVFNNLKELNKTFETLIETEFSDRSLAVLDSNADYSLVVNSIELYEDQWSEIYQDCYGDKQAYQLESVKLKMVVSLHDKSAFKIDSWIKIFSKTDSVKERALINDDANNETCYDPCIKEMGSFNEYKKMKKGLSALCRKITNKIVKIEK